MHQMNARDHLLKFPSFSSDVAHELNEMVLSQGMLDLRSFGYGHRCIKKIVTQLFFLILNAFLFKFWTSILLLWPRGWPGAEGRR